MSNRDTSVSHAKFNLDGYPLLELPALCFLMFLATSTFIMVAGLLLSLSFAFASRLIVVATSASVAWCVFRFVALARVQGSSSKVTLPVVMALLAALLTGVLAASINRPDMDDSVYAAKPVYYMEHPERPLDQGVTWLAGLPDEPHSIVFQYYETAQAALAWSLSVEFLSLYHIVFPFLVGTLMFLSVFLVLSLFDSRPWACLWATVVFVGVLLSLGETHRTFGNLSIARAFQGKFVFVEFGVFIWVYFSLRYLANPCKRSWWLLFVSGISMVGLTTTALVFLPILSAVLWGAYSINQRQLFKRAGFISGVQYCATLAPVIVWAMVFNLVASKYVAAGSSINAIFSSDFYGQLGYLFNPALPLTPVLFLLSTFVVVMYSPHRRFFLAWLIIPIVFMLNPIISPWVIKYVTTENIYWRFFYLLPFPLLIAVSALCLYHESLKAHLMQAAALVLLGCLALNGPTSVLRPGNNAHWALFSDKVTPGLLPVVNSMKHNLQSGSMFAPFEVAISIVLVTAKFPQYDFREDYLGYVLENAHMDGELQLRKKTASFFNDNPQDADARQAAAKLLSLVNGPAYVVLRDTTPHIDEAIDLLTQHDYTERPRAGSYRVFGKAETL